MDDSLPVTGRQALQISTLAELICQPYVLDPGSLEFLFEEAASVPDGVVRVTCRIFESGLKSAVERENLENFLRRAATHDQAHRRLEKSTLKMGRCPKTERSWLKRVLARGIGRAGTERSAHANARTTATPESPRTSKAPKRTATLDLRDLSGSIDEIPRILDRLGEVPDDLGRVAIKLSDFTYSSALAVLAQWILAKNLVGTYAFVECPPSMRAYLENIRFSQALVDPQIVVSPDPMDWAVGLTRINRELSTETVTDKIVDILTTFVNPKPEERSALAVMIAEMIENVHRHASAPVDGFAVAQVYPQRLKMGITLVDAGIGVRHSFETGEPSIPVGGLHSDRDFLNAAIQLHATSKKAGHSGYGLYLLSELISRNRGTFLLASGTATLIGYRRAGKLYVEGFSNSCWQGTIVSVIIDLSRELPLNQIYREMPVSGPDEDELFAR